MILLEYGNSVGPRTMKLVWVKI